MTQFTQVSLVKFFCKCRALELFIACRGVESLLKELIGFLLLTTIRRLVTRLCEVVLRLLPVLCFERRTALLHVAIKRP